MQAIGRMSASMERAFQQRVERLEATMHDAVAEAVAFLGKKATADARSEIETVSADAQMEIDKKLGPAGMERLARRAVWLVGGKMGARATALEAKAARGAPRKRSRFFLGATEENCINAASLSLIIKVRVRCLSGKA